MPIQQFSMEFKTPVTEAELRQAEKPIVSEMTDRHFSNDKSLLVVSEGTIQRRGLDDFAEGTFKIAKNTLYNANGEVVTELPPEAGMVVVSPQTRDFVAYNWAEFGGSPTMYFYSGDGTLLQQRQIFEQARVRFSQNGELVQVFDNTKKLAIFTRAGGLLFQGNSTELIKGLNSPLWGVFVSEQGELMLLATNKRIHLFTNQGTFLWESYTSGFHVSDCKFFSAQQKVVLQLLTSRGGDDRYRIQVHSLTTGEKFDEMAGVAEITSIDNYLLVKKEGKYYEYQVR